MKKNRLTIPPELEHLVEKRAREQRRMVQRREKLERRGEDADAAADELDVLEDDERRSGKNRRSQADRRQKRRRADD